MSAAVSKFDPQVVGEAAALPGAVSLEAAMAALPESGVQAQLSQWDARSVLGRYLAQGGMGNLAVQNMQRRAEMGEVTDMLLKLVRNEEKPDETRLLAAQSVLDSVAAHAKLADVELRLLEAASHGTKTQRAQSVAPSIHADVADIQQAPPEKNPERPVFSPDSPPIPV